MSKKKIANFFSNIYKGIKTLLIHTFTSNGKELSQNRIMLWIWFFYLLKYFDKAIATYGTIITKGSIVSMVEPAFAITIFIALCGYEFTKKTSLNIKDYKVDIENKDKNEKNN